MFNFFKKKPAPEPQAAEQPQPQQYATAPGTEIRYNPGLIPQLTDEHAALLALYGDIKAAFEAQNYPEVSRLLNEFRSMLQGHLLTENVRLYIYLDRQLGHDETNADLIREFRREMDGIAKVAINFLKKYDTIGVDKDLANAFGNDFERIGKVLVQRIQREESTLYPLYLASY